MNLRFLVLLLFCFSYSNAQLNVEQGYFMMPINPGHTTSLSGCFGDIRINHFHAGLDIRTGGREGLPVYAAAEGYISRIKVMTGGYGNALYITHPNGLTTLYGHLREYNDSIQTLLKRKQYQSKTWEIDLYLQPGEFKIKKGEIVALSGNTGGSAGPHLHFEIRDKEENVLDPSQFGFPEISDNVPPLIEFISLKCMSTDARINGDFGTFNFPVIRGKNGLYTVAKPISAIGKVAIEILTYDKNQSSPFRQGVNQINLKANNELVYNFRLDKMAFYNRLDMNMHVNYEKLISNNQKIHKCYVEQGNTFDFYKTNADKGVFEVNKETEIEIRVNDSFANSSVLRFEIKHETGSQSFKSNLGTSIHDNFLKIVYPQSQDSAVYNLTIRNQNSVSIIPLNSNRDNIAVLDLNKTGIPEEIRINNETYFLPINTNLNSYNPKVTLPNIIADFSDALYKPCFVNISENENELRLHEDIIPLKGLATVSWQKRGQIAYPDKFKVYIKGSKPKFVGGEWENSTIKFKTKEFGVFQLLYDLDEPNISVRRLSAESISFRISDALSGIKTIECIVNNEWILMNYEYKSGLIWSEKLPEMKPFSGNVVLKITDNCNNTKIFETTLPEL